ncbi:MAG: inositol monophosphatase [bacterium]|nr:inositol monophosphatase [bacterium]
MLAKDKKIIIEAAKAGGKIVRKYFGKTLSVEEKSCAWDFRTQADVESEVAILKILERAFPTYNILSEERGFVDRKSEYTFYVDPLDGTNNFVLGIPNFSVLIALARGKKALFGAVFLPMLDMAYHAEKGGGAFCGDILLKPSLETSIKNATVGYACGYKTPKLDIVRTISNLNLKGKVKRVLFNWSPAVDFCLLAAGKIESMINLKTEVYDFLGAKLILREAGCVVSDFKGKPDTDDFNPTFVVSNNQTIHRKILPLV